MYIDLVADTTSSINVTEISDDLTLKNFAKIMQDASSSEKAQVGRWGGEEFVIILRENGVPYATM